MNTCTNQITGGVACGRKVEDPPFCDRCNAIFLQLPAQTFSGSSSDKSRTIPDYKTARSTSKNSVRLGLGKR